MPTREEFTEALKAYPLMMLKPKLLNMPTKSVYLFDPAYIENYLSGGAAAGPEAGAITELFIEYDPAVHDKSPCWIEGLTHGWRIHYIEPPWSDNISWTEREHTILIDSDRPPQHWHRDHHPNMALVTLAEVFLRKKFDFSDRTPNTATYYPCMDLLDQDRPFVVVTMDGVPFKETRKSLSSCFMCVGMHGQSHLLYTLQSDIPKMTRELKTLERKVFDMKRELEALRVLTLPELKSRFRAAKQAYKLECKRLGIPCDLDALIPKETYHNG